VRHLIAKLEGFNDLLPKRVIVSTQAFTEYSVSDVIEQIMCWLLKDARLVK
jgi:hypothetical protein